MQNQQALMPDINATIHCTAKLKLIIVTDLTKAFYQIPLSNESMKFCRVAKLIRIVRIYKTTAMGIPGSETAFEELMSRVLKNLIPEGTLAKVANGLYCSAESTSALLKHNEDKSR